jgi:hypothetical protein
LKANADELFNNALNNEARFREGQMGVIKEEKIKGAEKDRRIADIDRLWQKFLEDLKKELGLAPLSQPEIQEYIKLLRAAGARVNVGAAQETRPKPETQQVMTQAARPDTGREIDWGKMGQSSQRAAGNGIAAEGQGTPPLSPQPVQPDTPRQINGDGIDWQSIEAAWDLEPAQQQAPRAPMQADESEAGLRPTPPLKPARRRKGQASP